MRRLTSRSTAPIAACGHRPDISFWTVDHKRIRSGSFKGQAAHSPPSTTHTKNYRITMPSLSTPAAAWTLLLIAGVLEIIWSTSMKASDGFSKHVYTAITLIAAWLSFWLLGMAMKSLPLGTAYAVWTGIGAVGAAILGMIFFKEPATAARILCIIAIVGGILGLKMLHK